MRQDNFYYVHVVVSCNHHLIPHPYVLVKHKISNKLLKVNRYNNGISLYLNILRNVFIIYLDIKLTFKIMFGEDTCNFEIVFMIVNILKGF